MKEYIPPKMNCAVLRQVKFLCLSADSDFNNMNFEELDEE